MKTINTTVAVALTTLAASTIANFAAADDVHWIDGVTGDWDNPANWDTGNVPGGADDVFANLGNITVGNGVNASYSYFRMAGNAGSATLHVNGGTLTGSFAAVGYSGPATVTVDNGGQWNEFQISLGVHGTGTLNITNGTVLVTDAIQFQTGQVGGNWGRINLGVGGLLSTDRLRGESILDDELNFNGGTLRAQQNEDEFIDSLKTTVNAAGGTIDSNGHNVTLGGALHGAGVLTKSGEGTLTASAIANNFSGGWAVNAGALAFNVNQQLGQPDVPLSFDGGTLRWGGNVQLTMNRPTTLNGDGGTIDLTGTGTLTQQAVITGTGSLTKSGPGTLVLEGDNTHQGGTAISGGTLRLAHDNAAGTGGITVLGSTISYADGVNVSNHMFLAHDASLEVLDGESAMQSDDIGQFPGNFAISKVGGGTLTLAAEGSYTGATTIHDGTLLVEGSLVNTTVTVNPGGTFGGGGSARALIGAGGTIAPGANGPATLGITLDLTLSSDTVLDYELDGLADTSDMIDITSGDLVLDGTLNITDLGGLEEGSYTLITYTGEISDNGLEIGSAPDGFSFTVDTTVPGEVTLNVETGDDCPADISDPADGQVNTSDLLELLANWGSDGPGAAIAEPSDVVDTADLLQLLAAWGSCR